MAGRVRSDSDGGDGVGGVIIDCLDLRKSIQMVLLCVYRRGGRAGGCVSNTDAVLDEPFVDSLGRMRHEDSAAEVGFGKDVWQGRGMINVKTAGMLH